ncbi:DUF4258 domain-containing protein [Calorimonas adulescens]|uniref:DUF4258 domain-containing protein n=2 Tax=Calorimonas adulescens TaxID=2606906 RepID=A0A5D8QAC0_9THEO|nr:DUF4258 domain-containing protein [Calorimonas adulescens]
MNKPKELIDKIKNSQIMWSKHAREKMQKYDISIDFVINGIMNGEIIEYIWRYGYGKLYIIFFINRHDGKSLCLFYV